MNTYEFLNAVMNAILAIFSDLAFIFVGLFAGLWICYVERRKYTLKLAQVENELLEINEILVQATKNEQEHTVDD